uniref:Arf-GAP with coiled-coil, ANK repeat and PH domain-containing protein 2 n=1 Tax=Aceria tosichella TaxID=561515 RepID=A0A6G1S6N0_9ACAR
MASIEMASKQSLDNSRTDVSNNHTTSMEPPAIDFDECLRDSPNFRQSLRDNLANVDQLESCMSRTMKQLANLIETGRDHMNSQKEFIQSLKTLNNVLGPSNRETSKRVNILIETFQEIIGLHEVVIDQSARTVGNSFSKFINDDLHKLKEARKSFDKISHECDQALTKYSQPIKKQQEDAENLLIATSTAFTHTSLDLSIQMTTLQSKKCYEILNSLLSLAKAHNTFFHQGYDLFEDLKPHITDMDQYLGNIQDEFETLTRNLPSKHLMVSNNELRPLVFDGKSENVHLEGYLFKRASNGFKVWNRRWFILKDHQLVYQKRNDAQPIVMEEDLRLLTVRPVDKVDCDRRFCFELLSPHKSHILQADSESACKTWIAAIQAGINAAFHDIEYKSRSLKTSNPVANELSSGSSSASGWGTSFSLKALQQQATNKLNSLTNLSETKEGSKSMPTQSSHDAKFPNSNRLTNCGLSGDEDDDNLEDESDYRQDDQGRSYAPLREDDDELETPSRGAVQTRDRPPQAKYPAPAPDNVQETNQSPASAPEKPQRAYKIILAMPGNDTCADCGAPEPRWASINLGITLCIECAGIHRSLGVHLSKVRSLTLDTEVWSPEIVQLMLSLGNNSVNSAYLACYRDQIPKIDADSCREEREDWIKSKYLLKKFMRPPDASGLDDSTNSNNVMDTSADTVVATDDKKSVSSSPLPQVNCSKSTSPNELPKDPLGET